MNHAIKRNFFEPRKMWDSNWNEKSGQKQK